MNFLSNCYLPLRCTAVLVDEEEAGYSVDDEREEDGKDADADGDNVGEDDKMFLWDENFSLNPLWEKFLKERWWKRRYEKEMRWQEDKPSLEWEFSAFIEK